MSKVKLPWLRLGHLPAGYIIVAYPQAERVVAVGSTEDDAVAECIRLIAAADRRTERKGFAHFPHVLNYFELRELKTQLHANPTSIANAEVVSRLLDTLDQLEDQYERLLERANEYNDKVVGGLNSITLAMDRTGIYAGVAAEDVLAEAKEALSNLQQELGIGEEPD